MSYLCAMIYELLIGIVIYALLFVVTMQSSRRKVVAMQERLDRVRILQEQQLRLELEEKKATLAYNNKVAMIENEKRQQAETVIFSSDIYHRIQDCLNSGHSLTADDWARLARLVDSIYTGFAEKLYGLYRMTEQEYHVSLLIKVRIQPKDIALLTAHSKESVATTRSRLYAKVFGRKGSSKEWDDFVLTL